MTNLTTNMALKKATASDNAETYLETDLGGSLDTVDAHRHRGGSSGLLVDTLSASQAAGDLFYATGANALARLAAGTTSQFLRGGAGAPSWSALLAADIAGLLPAASYIEQVGSTTTTSTTAVAVSGVSFNLVPIGTTALVWFAGEVSNSGAGNYGRTSLAVAGSVVANGNAYHSSNASEAGGSGGFFKVTGLTAGVAVNLALYWNVNAGTGTIGFGRVAALG